jgi:hypothetical protein
MWDDMGTPLKAQFVNERGQQYLLDILWDSHVSNHLWPELQRRCNDERTFQPHDLEIIPQIRPGSAMGRRAVSPPVATLFMMAQAAYIAMAWCGQEEIRAIAPMSQSGDSSLEFATSCGHWRKIRVVFDSQEQIDIIGISPGGSQGAKESDAFYPRNPACSQHKRKSRCEKLST